MTTPNIPDLPHVLAFSTGGSNSPLKVGGVDLGSVRIDGTTGNWYDPADLIRELSRFVPIPAEARKVITAWLARPVSTQQTVPERADDLLATLAAAGLLVGPGEPAAPKYAPLAWLDKGANLWVDPDAALAMHWLPPDGSVADGIPWYAHPPVTTEPASRILDNVRVESFGPHPHGMGQIVSVEPATAPSVEQIAEEASAHKRIEGVALMTNPPRVACRCGASFSSLADHDRHIAEEIRALWSSAPGDAAEAFTLANSHRWNGKTGREWMYAAADLESALAAANHNYANMRDGRLNDTLVENERLRAALEAAEALAAARLSAGNAQADYFNAYVACIGARDDYNAARAAVEADTEGGSR